MWQNWINFILGIIIFIAALANVSANWIYWLGGLLIAILGLWGGLSKPKTSA